MLSDGGAVQKRNIVFFIPKMIVGGVESVLLRTLEELGKRDDVTLSVFLHTPLAEPYFIEWFRQHKNIKCYVCSSLNAHFERYKCDMFPFKQIYKLIFGAYKRVKRLQMRTNSVLRNCDVVIDYANGHSQKMLQCIRKPKIMWFHGATEYFLAHNFVRRFPSYNRVVCITNRCKTDLAQKYPEYANKLAHIYNPVDYNDIADKSRGTRPLPYEYFLTVCRLDSDKGVDNVIDAFNLFRARTAADACKLVIIGEGPNAENLRKIAAESDAANDIIFLGKIVEPYDYMRGATANILASRHEGLGMVLVEAMACDTLNIASDCSCGPREVLLDGAAGILFETGNAQQLADAMLDVWCGKTNKDTLIANAKKSLSRFDAAGISQQIVDLVDETIEK